MAKLVLLFVVFAEVLSSAIGLSYRGLAEQQGQWKGWKTAFDKRYATEEEEKETQERWLRNKLFVDTHNRAFEEGKRTFRMEMNAFADQDLSKVRRPLVFDGGLSMSGMKRSSLPKARPSSWDWRKEGAVNAPVDQGQIGSALAIEVADAVASYAVIHELRQLYNLSTQELVDCCLPEPLIDYHVFVCIMDLGGLCVNGTYHSDKGCNSTSCHAVAMPWNGGFFVQSGNESALADAVYITPTVVGLDASHQSFQLYSSGVYSDPSCSSTQLDHALLLVGYGVDSSGTEYWICKNSWGQNWGEKGYIRIARNQHNMCGIATSAIYPI